MGSRLSIVAGLLAGLLAAGALLAGFVLVGPDPVRATPSPASSGAGGSPGASASLAASSPSAAASSGPSGSPASPGSSAVTENFHVGDPAPVLVVPQVGGGEIDLAALRGKPVWVNFMRTDCPPCVDEFPLMNGFAARYADEELVIVAVDIREEEGDVAAFAAGLNATFPLGLDTDGAAQREWGAFGLPVHYWVDREGVVRDGALGGIGADVMARGLQSILPGVVVTPTE
ncbi:MAG TPA: TlpA disulfide reductase family protein [Candidatus Limnocylindrales bacterium]|nr:TlpA disulfide reductase family protein [Candidatus Limnocylindrales bacterium]